MVRKALGSPRPDTLVKRAPDIAAHHVNLSTKPWTWGGMDITAVVILYQCSFQWVEAMPDGWKDNTF